MYTSKDGEGASSRMWERRRENLAAFHARKTQGLPPLTKHGKVNLPGFCDTVRAVVSDRDACGTCAACRRTEPPLGFCGGRLAHVVFTSGGLYSPGRVRQPFPGERCHACRKQV